jgi:ketosteroid isomerase-like protein
VDDHRGLPRGGHLSRPRRAAQLPRLDGERVRESGWNETGEPRWELLDPDIEYVIDPPAWLAGTYRGHAQFKWINSRGAEIFDEFRYEVDELLPAGDLVVSLGGIRVRGALSGASAVEKGFGVWEVRDGRIVRIRMYFDREEALRDAGLAE